VVPAARVLAVVALTVGFSVVALIAMTLARSH